MLVKDFFEEYESNSGEVRFQCRLCPEGSRKNYKKSLDGCTGSRLRHIRRHHPEIFHVHCGEHEQQQQPHQRHERRRAKARRPDSTSTSTTLEPELDDAKPSLTEHLLRTCRPNTSESSAFCACGLHESDSSCSGCRLNPADRSATSPEQPTSSAPAISVVAPIASVAAILPRASTPSAPSTASLKRGVWPVKTEVEPATAQLNVISSSAETSLNMAAVRLLADANSIPSDVTLADILRVQQEMIRSFSDRLSALESSMSSVQNALIQLLTRANNN